MVESDKEFNKNEAKFLRNLDPDDERLKQLILRYNIVPFLATLNQESAPHWRVNSDWHNKTPEQEFKDVLDEFRYHLAWLLPEDQSLDIIYEFTKLRNSSNAQRALEDAEQHIEIGLELTALFIAELLKLHSSALLKMPDLKSWQTEKFLKEPSSGTDRNKLSEEEQAEIIKRFMTPEGYLDAKAIREDSGLSQREFAETHGIRIDTLQSWEQKINRPKGPAETLLIAIILEPEAVRRSVAAGKLVLPQAAL